MGTRIRSILFDVLFYITSAIIMILFLPLMLLPQGATFWASRVWVHVTMALLKAIVGLDYQMVGQENVPSGPCIIASKHESAWETLIFLLLANHPAFALKRELTWIPVLNLYFKRMKMIIIDRGAGASALKNLLQSARRVREERRPLIIFPEGNRGVSGKRGDYKQGVAVLYRDLGIPVVPVALNSGLFWGRRSATKYPGQITVQFLTPIQPGLSKDEFMTKLEDQIENACVDLVREGLKYKPTKKRATGWGARLIQGGWVLLILAMGFDYGKHWVLKRALDQEISKSQGMVSVGSVSLSAWPLLQSHLIFQDFAVHASGVPVSVTSVSLRQGWQDWHLAQVKAIKVKVAEYAFIQQADGILDTTNLNEKIKVSPLNLSGVDVKFPLLSLEGPRASFEFLYEIGAHHLFLKTDIPEISFSQGGPFGVKGEGDFHVVPELEGMMKININNIDTMLKGLVKAKVVDSSQADIVTGGTQFFANLGLHDLTLPLKVKAGRVSLGPLPLFEIK